MMLSSAIRFAGLGLPLLLLPACSLAPAYDRPGLPVPPSVASDAAGAYGNAGGDPAVFGAGWRDFFKDARLQELIALSLEHNRDLKIAALAVAEARALYGVQNADRFPQLDAEGSGGWTGDFRGASSRTYEVAAVPFFDLDLFGRLKNMSESALQSYLGTKEAEKAVRIALVSQVAQAYLTETLAEERRQLAADTLESWRKSFSFIERRVQSGQSSLLDMEQARSMIEAASAAVAEREREAVQAGNALRLLTGSFERRELPPVTPLRSLTFAALPQGIASTALLNRPDVMEAEHALLAANADIGAARAAFFPSISLTGNLGYMSADLTALFSGATSVWSFLPTVSLPLFNAGRNAANLELAEVRKESSVARYEKSIQTAFREVADGLMSRASFEKQREAQERYLASQRLVLKLAMGRYANGAISYLEVLDAQRAIFQAEQDLLGIRRDQLANDILLFSALGGGLRAASGEPAPDP
ncbi:MAG: efflux transporter outer membrane subunit [Deltaproteobacteria bacterium]|jgi:Cu(I)/Ag(I) efflux system outer membrane protein|nr:efflux transporter outer membrane subunit [Deltaproteobacteria bacterium]